MNTSHPFKLDGEQLSAQLLNSLANIITENKLQPKLNIILTIELLMFDFNESIILLKLFMLLVVASL